jgi:hypothetical protein
MPAEDDDDVYDGDYEFVDDEVEDELDDATDEDDDAPGESVEDEDVPASRTANAEAEPEEEVVDPYDRPAPLANYVVHIYEYQKFRRTIDRPFTAEDAEAFASEYNRTAKPYGRFALAGKDDAKPRKTLD